MRVSGRLLAAIGIVASFGMPPFSGTARGQAGPAEIDPRLLSELWWRNLGPYRGGRVTAVVGVPHQPFVYYFGATGGGVWKTTDGGVRWEPISDGQFRTGSVGALAVAESNPNFIYVGMGEACIRGNVSHGDGVYKSTDAGKTWKNVGLQATRQIGRVRIHPRDPELVYVAALGHTFGPSEERGIFRSKDGGATWERVLFVDERTGAVDLVMDPSDPRVLYAAFWQVYRTPYSLESGGPGSALYKSVDGGDTWRRLTGSGLPANGIWGRVGVAVSPARPNQLWALIEAEDGGLFRSENAGGTWQKVSEERILRQRAWYYTHVYADPRNPETVYVLNVDFLRSTDGGRTFSSVPVPHGDNHDLWIAEEDPLRMIEANDGGVNVSFNGGRSWSSQENQPTAQFYGVIADNQFPYHVYGAQQDNTTVAIASRTKGSGIDRTDWYTVGGGESGSVAPHRLDPNIVYAGSYHGYISRYDHRTKDVRDITVYPERPMGWGAEGMKYRFQWTFPILTSHHDPRAVYAAGNILFMSTNDGQNWRAISPDLTRNDPTRLGPSGGPITKDNSGVEYYGTIFALAESRLEKGLLWAGSDDGLVHVTHDGGRSWTNVTPPDMPEWSLVSKIEASPHEAGKAYLAINRYKLDDHRPYIYVTRDSGKTWRTITKGIPEEAFVRFVREDPVRRGLLYAGSETGVHVSFDGGDHWQSLQRNLPVVPVTDLVLKDDDVVISTQGRGFWVLDDVTPLHQLDEATARSNAHLFKPRTVPLFFAQDRSRPNVGQNPPSGLIVYYSLQRAPEEGKEVTLEFLDAGGRSIRRFSSFREEPSGPDYLVKFYGAPPTLPKLPAKPGLNRFVWDLRHPQPTWFEGMILSGNWPRGPRVVPGTYQVKLAVGGTTMTQAFEIRKSPQISTTQAEYEQRFDLLMRIRDKVSETHDTIARIRQFRAQVEAIAPTLGNAKALSDEARNLMTGFTAIEEALYQTRNQSRQDPINFPIRLNNKLSALTAVVESAEAAPTDQSYEVYGDITEKIDAQLAILKDLTARLSAFKQRVRSYVVDSPFQAAMSEALRTPPLVRFGPFEVDVRAGELRRGGSKIRLQDGPFRILEALLERPAQVVTREELQERLWPTGTFVDFNHSLNSAMNRLREALGDSADRPRYIETLSRRGYRLIAQVEQVGRPAAIPLPLEAAPAFSIRPRLPTGKIMLAVLPFENMSGDPEQEYFSDGLTEEMTSQLGRLRPDLLGVIARTSALRYKRTDKAVDQIGRELGVDYLLEGSVRRAAARVRITAQLIQVSDQTHLWAESYEGDLTDVLSLQSEVARAIAREIRTAIDPQEEDRLSRAQARKVSPEAFEAYLKGRYFLDKGPQGAEKSLEYCRAAIEIDPTYASAWAALADTWAVIGFRYCTVPPRKVFPEARGAALKALELEQGLAEAHISLANVLAAYDWDWPAAEVAFRHGLELNPNSALAHSHYYGFLLRLERHDEAVAELRRAQELDPLSLHVNYDLGWHLYRTRQYDRAIEQMKKAVELDPLSSWAQHALGEMCAEKGLFDEALLHMRRAIELSPDIPHYLSAMGYIFGCAGQPGEAHRLLDKLERQARKRYIAPHEMALVHTGLRENDKAFAWFDRAFEERDPWLTLLRIAPKLDGIRDDPRFANLVRRLGFPT